MKLPKKRNMIKEANPKFLVITGKPKSGKTTAIQGLEDALHIDLDNSKQYVATKAVTINTPKDLKELILLLREAISDKKPYAYTFGIIDTATDLEHLCLSLALTKYRSTSMGKNYKKNKQTGEYLDADIRELPNGGGYFYIRMVYKNIINELKKYFKYLILIGHTKDKTLDEDDVMNKHQLDLSGKLGRIILANAEAVGFLYREKNNTYISFEGGGDHLVGSSSPHLRNKKVLITTYARELGFSFFWDKIYKNETKAIGQPPVLLQEGADFG